MDRSRLRQILCGRAFSGTCPPPYVRSKAALRVNLGHIEFVQNTHCETRVRLRGVRRPSADTIGHDNQARL